MGYTTFVGIPYFVKIERMFIINKRCIIISGSPVCCDFDILPSDYVIACDKGYQHAKNLNIVPDIIMGDFDSYKGELNNINENIKVIKAPCEKNDTDTLMAVKYAMEKGFNDFILLGATKGRLDHLMANFSACAFIASKGCKCKMIDDENIIFAIKDSNLVLEKKENYSVSVFSYTDKSVGVSLKGLEYPLDNVVLTNLFPIGVSNEFKDDIATIEVKSGILIVILSNLEMEK